MWDNMKFRAAKEWETQRPWVERQPLSKWQMSYLFIPKESYPYSVTSLDIIIRDHFYKCKFLFTVTHINKTSIKPWIANRVCSVHPRDLAGLICCCIHSQIWLESPNLSVNSWIRSLSYMEYWSQFSRAFSGARVAMSAIFKMIVLCSQSRGSYFFHCPWKSSTSLHYTQPSVCTSDHLLHWHSAWLQKENKWERNKRGRSKLLSFLCYRC